MTLQREGWIDDRPFAVVRDDDGTEVAFVCLKCRTETVPDPRAFAAHRCYKAMSHLKRRREHHG